MSYEERLSAAIKLIEQHNSVVGMLPAEFAPAPAMIYNPGAVEVVKFTTYLKALGGTTESALSNLKWEQISMCLANSLYDANCPVKPEQLAKDIADIFRGKTDDGATPDKPGYVGPKKVRQMTVRQLVENFDPEEPDGEVGKRLQGIVGNKPCIVFDKPGSRQINVDTTFKLVDEIKKGYPARQSAKGEIWAIVDVGGTPKPAYPMGYLPENFAEENPLYPGRPLRPDGTCDQTNRSWGGVSLEIRQFLRVGLDIKEIVITRLEDAHNLLDMALSTDAMKKLDRYSQTKVKFEQLKSRNKLPDLQVPLGSKASVVAKSPFEQGVRVSWATPPVPGANYYIANNANNTLTFGWGNVVKVRRDS
jgi:hypothetical protein